MMANRRIYFDHAATTPLHPRVWEAMAAIHESAFGNPSSIHAEGRLTRTIIEEARRQVARALQASLGEIFFTSCGTESNNMILRGAVRDLGIRRIISSPVEHHCILHTLAYLDRHHGTQVELLPVNPQGLVETDQLEAALSRPDAPPTLVSLMHVNNETGAMHDLEAIGSVCRWHGALFHSDTVQSVGFQSLDLSTLPVDFIAGSAHKFYGPKGCGFVYIRSDYALKPLLLGGSQERNMRAGTENILGIHGMASALSLASEEGQGRLTHLTALRDTLRAGLQEALPGITINGEGASGVSPKILSVNIPAGDRREMLLMLLDIAGISASGGSACSSGVEAASHVLAHLPIDEDTRTIRFSFSPWNTQEEAQKVIQVLRETLHPGK